MCHCCESCKTIFKPCLLFAYVHFRSEAYQTLKKLEAARWIDRRTRAVVVEMTLFNPATNLFSGVNLLLEIPPSGGVTVSAHVSSVYLYKYISSWDNFILACEVCSLKNICSSISIAFYIKVSTTSVRLML